MPLRCQWFPGGIPSAPVSAEPETKRRADLVRPATPIGPAAAAGGWTFGWVGGSLLVAPLVIAAVGAELGDDLTIPQLAAVVAGGWIMFGAALVFVSRRQGTGSPVRDYAIRFAPIDLVGVPIGIATQLALVPALYWPLRSVWPDTFSGDRLEQRARELADSAGGWKTLLLIGIVVVGAPLVEEIVYRGMLQRSFATAIGPVFGLLTVSVWFSLIHLSPVEYPGLFLAGLVFGGTLLVTDRLGPAIVTHAAFNATGLLFVL